MGISRIAFLLPALFAEMERTFAWPWPSRPPTAVASNGPVGG